MCAHCRVDFSEWKNSELLSLTVGIELLGQLEIQKNPETQEFLRNLKESFFYVCRTTRFCLVHLFYNF